MSHRLINPTDVPAAGTNACDLFERKLREALVDGIHTVAVCLRPEMGACVELIDWLSKWRKTFANSKREMIIVASDTMQYQYLDLSHPDERLIYVSSIEDLMKLYPVFNTPEPAPAQTVQPAAPAEKNPVKESEQMIAAGSAHVPAPAVQAPQNMQQDIPSHTAFSEEPSLKNHAEQQVSGGQVVKISGEYACKGCGMTRMFAKGDSAQTCSNPECPHRTNGWKLIFELF